MSVKMAERTVAKSVQSVSFCRAPMILEVATVIRAAAVATKDAGSNMIKDDENVGPLT
jgi:hypothetical protein